MELQQSGYPDGSVRAENIGGITKTTIDFSPGVTVLVGRNATNRTSFLQAVMAALGSENVAIKGDADEAEVELTLGDQTYTRHLSRRSGEIVTRGDPYLDDAELADLFAFLLESNEARRAVATGQNLRELIMRPVDTDEIQSEIDRLKQKRKSLEEELDNIENLKSELPELEERRKKIQTKIQDKKSELEAKEKELEAADADIQETREEKSKLDDKLEQLRDKRSKLDNLRYEIETEQESLKALEKEKTELKAEREDIADTPVGEIKELESEIERLRQRKQQIESEISEIQSVIGFNEDMLEETMSDIFESLTETEQGTPTDQLIDDEREICWTCGSHVDREQIQSTVDRLRELSQSKVSKVKNIEKEIDDLQSEKNELNQAQREKERIDQRLDNIENEIEKAGQKIEDLQNRREDLTTEIETVEAEVEDLEEDDYSAVLDLHKEANQIEYDLGKLENDLERIEGNIAKIEEQIAAQDETEAQLEEVSAEIESLRTKINQIEQDSIDMFNEHMDEVLERLNYSNIDRIWIEKFEKEIREGRRKVDKSVFEIHVIRTSESGVAYEDTIDHLSESEREVTGLVFALAGYLAHKVYEDLPFMLLDSLESIDSDRIAKLIDYLTDYTGYLIVALLPEDATTLPDKYTRINEI